MCLYAQPTAGGKTQASASPLLSLNPGGPQSSNPQQLGKCKRRWRSGSPSKANSARTEDLLPGRRASRQEKKEESTERGGSPSASPVPQALSASLKSLPKEETWHAPQDRAAHWREGTSWQRPLLHLHPPLLPFSNISSCGSQWSFLQVKKIQSTTHPTAINMSFVQVLRGHKRVGRPPATVYSLIRQLLTTWHVEQQCVSQ